MFQVTEKQQNIINAFFLAAQENPNAPMISAQMIAEKAGIVRQTIYKKHFTSMEDLIDTIHYTVSEPCEQKLELFLKEGNGDLIKFFAVDMLPILYSFKDWIRTLFTTTADPSWFPFLNQVYTPLIERHLKEANHKIDLPLSFISNVIVIQLIAVISNWLTSESPETPEIFADKFIQILSMSTSDLLTGK